MVTCENHASNLSLAIKMSPTVDLYARHHKATKCGFPPRCIDMELDGVISLEKGHVKLEAKRCKIVTTKGTRHIFAMASRGKRLHSLDMILGKC